MMSERSPTPSHPSRRPPSRRQRLTVLGAALACLLAASCGSDEPVSHRADTSRWPTGERCLAELRDRGTVFTRERDFHNDQGCGIDTAITLTAPSVALARPMETSCSMALALDDFLSRVAQPAARRYFGQRLVRIHHYGSYNCRGRSSDRSRLSEHAFGRAVDVYGFELADGRIITVEGDWNAGGDAERFLRSVGEQACSQFSIVLGPSSGSDHRNHFHFDIGPWTLCEP